MNADLTTTLPPGFPRPSAALYHDDRLYIGGRTAPAWLASLRASDLGDHKFIQFPVENHPNSGQPKYTVVLKLLWYQDRLHVLFSGSSQLTIAEVDPLTWAWRDVISTTRGNDILSFWNNGKVVYVSGYGQDVTIGMGVISYFTPPVPPSPIQPMDELLVPDVVGQYAPLLGAGGSLYYVNGDAKDDANIMLAKFSLGAENPVIRNTKGLRMQSLGPDTVEFGEHLYLSFFMSSVFGSEIGVPPDRIFRVNKQSLLVDTLTIDGTPRGAVLDFWSDGNSLWILRTGTLSRYDGTTFEHYDLGVERPELLVGDNAGHLYGVERGNPVVVRRYSIPSPKPTPAFIVGSDATSLTLGDGQGSKWRVPATPA